MPSGMIKPKSSISGSVNKNSAAFNSVISGGGGTADHTRLFNRDANDQHPISAITDLQKELDEKLDTETALPLIEEAIKNKAKGLYYDSAKELASKSYWYLTAEINSETKQGTKESIISGPYDLGQGGGGGGGVTVVTIKNTDPITGESLWPATVAFGGECKPKVYWTSTKEGIATGNGTIYVTLNDTQIITKTVAQGYVELDIGKYIISGNNTLQVKVVDAYGVSGIIIGNINAITIGLTSKFNYALPYKDSVKYTYIPIGDIEKTVYFYVDGNLYTTQIVKTTKEQQSCLISGFPHGHHTLLVYLTAEIDGTIIKSEELYYDLIIYNDGNLTPIIASQFRDFEQTQYISFNIPYRVYTPNKNTSEVNLYVDDILEKTLIVGQAEQLWEYSSSTAGMYALKITSGIATRSFDVHIKESEIPVRPVTQDLALALNSVGRSNSEPPEMRIKWEDIEHSISCTLENFNFSSDGWLKDSENNTVLRVAGDARVTIPYQPFKGDLGNTGKTIELEITTSVVRNYETVIISCFDGSRGFYVTPQLAKIKSQLSDLQTQYKEDDHVRLAFVVEDTASNRIMYMYINGVMSGAVQYPIDDSFRQLDPQNITIGTNDATVDIYNIRVYDNGLSRKQVVNNWIADTQNEALKSTRYTHNNIYNDQGEITTSLLPKDLPHIIWDIDPLPQYKGDKRPGQATYVDESTPARSFTLPKEGDYNVQGTSSAVYPVKNIRLKSKAGFMDTNGDIYPKFTIRGKTINDTDYIGANYFTYKVDYASSEGANNVELTRLYNDVSKAKEILTPPQKFNSKVRVGIDGFPVAAFHKDSTGKITFTTKANFNNDKANEDVYGFADGDESWEINNNSADEAKFKIGNIDRIDHYDEKTGEPVYVWEAAFEIRYPDIDGYGKKAEEIKKLNEMVTWVASTYRAKATGAAITPVTYKYTEVVRSEDGTYTTRTVEKTFTNDTEDYRLAKFKAELKNHFDVDSSIFYYIFTHLYLMIDSRAKNAFPTYYASRTGVQKEDGSYTDGGNRWFWLPYDMDTAIGINNEGKLVFDYNLEDTDKIGGSDVFNGQDSVMWCNLRDAFDGEIAKMYSELRTSGSLLSFDNTEARFQEHQNKWPENLFNEDSYVKYIKVLIDSGENYLEMLQGSKAEQRRWWLYNRFKYFDSMYIAGDALADHILFRAYVPAGTPKPNINVIPYADVYATASFANAAGKGAHKRAFRDQTTTLINPFKTEEAETDQETHIYPASQLKSIGDISGFYPDTVKVANAIKLQELIVGSGTEGYENPNLTSLELGANTLLRLLDVRNCPNLKSAIDVSACTNIEEIYFDGTAITGVILPDGGTLKKLHLPDTITLLKIKNQKLLNEFILAGTQNLESLWLENVPSAIIDSYEYVMAMPNGSRVRLIGIDNIYDSAESIKAFYNKLDLMHGIDESGAYTEKAQVTGIIYINTISYADYVALSARYSEVKIVAAQIICSVNFYNESVLFKTENVIQGHDATDPGIPEKEPTVQYYYTFSRWDKPYTNVQTDLDIHAIFEEHIQIYRTTFNTQSSIIKVEPEFEDKEYGSLLDEPTLKNIPEHVVFLGWYRPDNTIWNFETDKVLGPCELKARWSDEGSPVIELLERQTFDTFGFVCTDNIGISARAIVKNTSAEPTTWETLPEPITPYIGIYTVDEAADYYFWVKDAKNNMANRKIIARQIDYIAGIGIVSIKLTEDGKIINNTALSGTVAHLKVTIDSHYENLKIYINDVEVDNDIDITIDSNIVIKATCTPKSYTVKFDLDNKGIPIPDQVIVYQNKVTKPLDQYYEGEVTRGWYLDAEYTTEWNFNTDTVSADTTLFAKWVEYHEPSKLTIITESADTTITLNFTQAEARTVEVKWGDSGISEYSSDTGVITLTHNYSVPSAYIIEVLGDGHQYNLGGDIITKPVILPANCLKKAEFSFDLPSLNRYALANTAITETGLTAYMSKVSVGTYYMCTNLVDLSLPSTIKYIEAYAFEGCTAAAGDITLSKDLKSISDAAFMGCTGLTSININLPDNVVLGTSIFEDCTGITSVTFDCGNITLGNRFLYGCLGLTSIEMPAQVNLGDLTFGNCINLQSAIINSSIIGTTTFAACRSLAKVKLTNKELVLGRFSFNDCTKLTSAGPIGGDYCIEFAWDTEIPAYAFSYGYGQSNLSNIILPSTITKIGDYAFINCMFSKINLPYGLTSIGEQAFFRTVLQTIEIPETVTNIGKNAFAYVKTFTKVTLKLLSSNTKIEMTEDSWFLYTGITGRSSIIVFVNPAIIDSPGSYFGPAWNSDELLADIPYTAY